MKQNLKYDAIIVGAGSGGLTCAIELAKTKKRVLVIERHNLPGGRCSSFCRGRFEFEASLPHLHFVSNAGFLNRLFTSYGFMNEIKWIKIQNGYEYIEGDFHYLLPLNLNQFVRDMKQIEPNNEKPLKWLIEQAKHDYDLINQANYDFKKIIHKSVNQVFDEINLTGIARNIISNYWMYLGCDLNSTNFSLFIAHWYQYMNQMTLIPKNRSHEISVHLEKKFRELGGEIWFNTTVDEILIKDHQVNGVRIDNKQIINAPIVVANIASQYVIDQLIKEKPACILNHKYNKTNISVFLGLNKSFSDLSIKHYNYLINKNDNYKDQSNIMQSLNENHSLTAQCLSVLDETMCFKGSCLLTLNTFVNENVWNQINIKDYFKVKETVGLNLIESFEKATGIKLKPYIEDVEIATAISYGHFINSPDGVSNGYINQPLINHDNHIIKNLYFVGKFASNLPSHAFAYINGYLTAQLIKKEHQF